eukprot:scaffold208922_cov22-Tisochrysis_lutea.AAC.1
MEARSLPVEQSKPLLIKVKEYRADLGSLKDHAKQASKSTAALGDAARAELVGAEPFHAYMNNLIRRFVIIGRPTGP